VTEVRGRAQPDRVGGHRMGTQTGLTCASGSCDRCLANISVGEDSWCFDIIPILAREWIDSRNLKFKKIIIVPLFPSSPIRFCIRINRFDILECLEIFLHLLFATLLAGLVESFVFADYHFFLG
jgi:hypothetical protein